AYHDHPGEHELGLQKKTALLDHIAETRLGSDELGRHDAHPANPKGYPEAGKDHREGARNQHIPNQHARRRAKTKGRIYLGSLAVADWRVGADKDGKDRTDEDEEIARRIADTKPENCQRRPSNGRDRPKSLDKRLDEVGERAKPAENDAKRQTDQASQ